MAELELNWIEGNGWLIFSGGPDVLSDIRAMALTRIVADGGVAYIGLDANDADLLMDDMNELGAPTGYLVNVMTEDDDTIRQQLKDAAMIVIPGNLDLTTLHSAIKGAAIEGMRAMYERGGLIFAEGDAVMLFGKVFRPAPGIVHDGLDWVQDAVLVPGAGNVNDSQAALEVLSVHAAKIAVGIGVGSALALGRGGQAEIWGEMAVSLAFDNA